MKDARWRERKFEFETSVQSESRSDPQNSFGTDYSNQALDKDGECLDEKFTHLKTYSNLFTFCSSVSKTWQNGQYKKIC